MNYYNLCNLLKIINQLNPFNLWLKSPAAKHFSLFTFHLISDSAGILTQDLQNRNLTLYTAKLRSHKKVKR